jgi:copper homeostasis protein (lipoprotein)
MMVDTATLVKVRKVEQMRITSLLVVTSLISIGCSAPTTDNNMHPLAEDTVVVDHHNAQNALDIEGIYFGVVPCASCPGIETTVTLGVGGAYLLTTVYQGEEDNMHQEAGVYSWNSDGNSIVLNGIENAPNSYFVGENTLTQLDLSGKRIIGEMADNYVLKKK